MKLRVKSNGNEVEMKKEKFDKLSPDQKLSYDVISVTDAPDKKEQVVKDETKKSEAPANGDKDKK